MVDVSGYVIILLKTKDRKIKLYGSFADKEDLKIDDEILDVNGHTLSDATRSQAIAHINQCIKSRVICLRCRHTPNRPEIDLNSVQDAFVIAVEPHARERLERLATHHKIQPVDMAKLCQQLNRPSSFLHSTSAELKSIADNKHQPSASSALTATIAAAVTATVTTPVNQNKENRNNFLYAHNQVNCSTHPSIDQSSVDLIPNSITPGPSQREYYIPSTKFNDQKEEHSEEIVDRNFSLDTDELDSIKTRRISLSTPSPTNDAESRTERRRASSPFTNGGTELLIGQQAANKIKTTAIIEHHSAFLSANSTELRRGKKSGIVADSIKIDYSSDEKNKFGVTENNNRMMMVMAAVDNGPHRGDQGTELPIMDTGPHRELPVDVPESFIARTKTPPRYPPPKPRPSSQIVTNGAVQNHHSNVVPAVPLSPPRLTTTSTLNNNSVSTRSKEPTEEQLHSIKKYQEALRKRKEEEERIAQETEFLNRSLRGSKKLQALKENTPSEKSVTPPTGFVNNAYVDDDIFVEEPEQLLVKEDLHKTINYGEMFAAFQRLQLQIKRAADINIRMLDPVHNLLQSQNFHTTLSIHNKVQHVWPTSDIKQPVVSDVKSLIADCLKDLQGSSSTDVSKLTELLARYEVDELLDAHDTIIRNYFPETDTPEELTELSEVQSSAYKINSDNGTNIRIIKIDKANEPLGATVKNEGEAVIIGRVVKGGVAEKSGLLHEGDEILEVDGIEMRGKSVNEVCDILSAMKGTLTFLIVPCSSSNASDNAYNTSKDVLIYVKALFDYDAEDDIYVPCRELGISFQKGDILIIKSQEDPNWWQAYRYGEHDHTLAGLIPSKSFQLQRDAKKKQSLTGEKFNREKSRKAGAFLCTKKNLKKRRKKSPHHTYQDGCYPLYSSSSTDEFDGEEIPTYEEVVWYYPSMNHKRPVVLIGPPNIGRHELRQRLMEDSDRFAAAVPHTSRSRKEGEVDGQDYHFISRIQFESDILARKFVEHGEYEKAYYGTSLDAIRSVVSSGKICVLNLHAQSLKILRDSDLMPYVVFVAPPSLEKLRQKKIKSGEPYKEEELKDIIEKARDMEDKYGHYFDMIIINNDTERAYRELLVEINKVEREPQWIPATWARSGLTRSINPQLRSGPYFARGN